jgi:hypothetical protein
MIPRFFRMHGIISAKRWFSSVIIADGVRVAARGTEFQISTNTTEPSNS